MSVRLPGSLSFYTGLCILFGGRSCFKENGKARKGSTMRKMAVNGCSVFAVLLLLSLDPEVMSDSNCNIVSNGCSLPANLPFVLKRIFRPACVKHDVCNDCGQHWRWTKLHCDWRFEQDMYKRCEKKFGNGKLKRCYAYADWYHGYVFVAGKSYFSKVPPDWCKNPCTESRGDPSTSL